MRFLNTVHFLIYIFLCFRYFSSESPEFPAVIYSSEDVNHPGLVHHQGHLKQPCHSHHLHLKTRERWLHDDPLHHNHSHLHNKFESLPESSHFHNGILTVNEPSHGRHMPSNKKHRRASGDYYNKKKNTCMLYLQADHLFYEQMGRSEEACIDVMTRHVQRVNSIYRSVGE